MPERTDQRTLAVTREELQNAACNLLNADDGPLAGGQLFMVVPDPGDISGDVLFTLVQHELVADELVALIIGELGRPHGDGAGVNACDLCGVLFVGEHYSVPGVNGGPGHCSCVTCCAAVEREARACAERSGPGSTVEGVAATIARNFAARGGAR